MVVAPEEEMSAARSAGRLTSGLAASGTSCRCRGKTSRATGGDSPLPRQRTARRPNHLGEEIRESLGVADENTEQERRSRNTGGVRGREDGLRPERVWAGLVPVEPATWNAEEVET